MISYLFPGGRQLVLTFSYDDGNQCDKHLADIFNAYNMKATFNLNGASLEHEGKIHADELKPLFIDHGHEVACHGYTHPFFEKLNPIDCVEEIRLDKLALEKAIGMPVRGFAYPFGTFNDTVKGVLKSMGIVYARTVTNARSTTYMPDDFLEWHPTTHHNGDILSRCDTFLNTPAWYGTHMLYVWGHAFEFENGKNWSIMEDFCKKMANHDHVWYATNIEIYDYVQAFRRLIFSADQHLVQNPSLISVWLNVRGKTIEVKPGALLELE